MIDNGSQMTIADLSETEFFNALSRVHKTNDMLPPREDDKVADRIAKRFTSGLHARIAAGDYAPGLGNVVSVAKSKYSTRPASVLSLEDRVIYEALVERTRLRITKSLLSADTVLWPRADSTAPKFSLLDEAPLLGTPAFILTSDVAGFYESVGHTQLRTVLIQAGVPAQLADDIKTFLYAIMGTSRGLPQGVETSDSLATVFLSQVDRKLQTDGLRFWRHGDDYRIAVDDFTSALAAAHHMESALRSAGLLANQRKVSVVNADEYRKWRSDIADATESFRDRIHEARVSSAWQMNDSQLAELAVDFDLDEDMQWKYFYHGLGDLEQVVDALAPLLAPKPIEVIEEMFKELFEPTITLLAELWHSRLKFCLQHLAGARSTVPLPYLYRIVNEYPSETQTVCNYLLALLKKSPIEVAEFVVEALSTSPYLTDWQSGWLLRVLSRCAHYADVGFLSTLKLVVSSDSFTWFHRVESARVLAAVGELTAPVARQILDNAPRAFASDIVGIVAAKASDFPWSPPFLEAAKLDPLHAVVINGVIQKVESNKIT